jgi:hypothetical protein
VVEGNRLEICRTRKGTAGSNPALSATALASAVAPPSCDGATVLANDSWLFVGMLLFTHVVFLRNSESERKELFL